MRRATILPLSSPESAQERVVTLPSPTRQARPAAQLLRQHLRPDAAPQDEENALETCATGRLRSHENPVSPAGQR